MKSIGDGSARDGLLSASDLSAYFDKLWTELDGLEKCDAKSDLTDGDVRLDCTGELVDVASIGAWRSQTSASGAGLIAFVCPRCNHPHESLRFGGAVSAMEKR